MTQDPTRDLALLITRMIKLSSLTQAQAAQISGATRSDISRIMRGDVREFSLERILRLAQRLGCRVEIRVTPPADMLIHPEAGEGTMVLDVRVTGSQHP